DCMYKIVENPAGVCDRQIFNIGSPKNEVSIAQLAEMMREIYVERFGGVRALLPEVVSVPGDVFYGEGYDDSDRRIPDITKAQVLLGWEPTWEMREMLEATMRHFISRRAANSTTSAAAN